MNDSDLQKKALLALVHDVGKYLARTARNLGQNPALPLPSSLLQMLISDLYEGKQGKRPSVHFAQVLALVPTLKSDTRLDTVATLLQELDADEELVRKQNAPAVYRVIAKALQVEAALREVLLHPSVMPKSRRKKASP